jgi:hypothetical protein
LGSLFWREFIDKLLICSNLRFIFGLEWFGGAKPRGIGGRILGWGDFWADDCKFEHLKMERMEVLSEF